MHAFPAKYLAAPWLALSLACAHGSSRGATTPGFQILTGKPRIELQTLNDVRLAFPWELQNQSTLPVEVRAVSWKLEIDGEPSLSGSGRPGVAAAPGASAESVLAVTASLGASDPGLPTAEVLSYQLVATFDVDVGAGPQTSQQEWSGELFAPRTPTVALEAQAARYDGEGIELSLSIAVQNPNPFPLPVEALDYAVLIEDVEVSRGQLAQGDTVQAGSELHYELSRYLGREDLPQLARDLGARPRIPYSMENQLRTAGRVLSTPVEGELTFAR